ncbi:MAG: phage portal protein [Flavobacteriaceae bacterium]
MAIRDWLRRALEPRPAPRAAVQHRGGGVIINTSQDLEEALRDGAGAVTPETAMRTAAVNACVRVITGPVGNLPTDLKRKLGPREREDAEDHPLHAVLTRRPNRWQTPSQFKKMMQAHVLLRGNAYARIVRSVARRGVVELIPLHPDRVRCRQNDDLSLSFEYRRPSGGPVTFAQRDIMHLVGLTLDGVHGVSVIAYARETIKFSMAMEEHGLTTFRNGARPSSVLKHPGILGPEGTENLRASLDDYRAGGESEGKALILEEGMSVETLAMTSEDAQWLESRKFTRSDIAMFFGVPPHMIGDTEKSTSWGSGIEQQSIGFVTYTLEDHLTAWEETINRDLLEPGETDLYARFNRSALVRGDIKTRWSTYATAMQWGAMSPNEVRALEDLNPREGGDDFYDPPNTAGGASDQKGNGDEPPQPA